MTKTMNFYQKEVYGSTLLYLENEKDLRTVSALTGRKTLKTRDMEALQKLGVRFNQVLPPIKN